MCFDLWQNNGFYSLLFTVMAATWRLFFPHSRTEITKIVVYVLQRTCMKCSHGMSGVGPGIFIG